MQVDANVILQLTPILKNLSCLSVEQHTVFSVVEIRLEKRVRQMAQHVNQ